MKYLYLFLELLLYSAVIMLYLPLFSRYKYHPRIERKIEQQHKTLQWKSILMLSLFSCAVAAVFILWHNLYPGQFHHIGYFTAFLCATVIALFLFRKWTFHVDLKLCLPAMFIVCLLLLAFESILLYNNAGWIYTDSTVFSFSIGPRITIILENLIFFYLFSPFMSILIFTAMAYNRSDKTAFILANIFIWITGAIWEYICIARFKLWYMIEERSIFAFNLFDARTTLEEMLYYVPFASISILLYLHFYYRKYPYRFASVKQKKNT